MFIVTQWAAFLQRRKFSPLETSENFRKERVTEQKRTFGMKRLFPRQCKTLSRLVECCHGFPKGAIQKGDYSWVTFLILK